MSSDILQCTIRYGLGLSLVVVFALYKVIYWLGNGENQMITPVELKRLEKDYERLSGRIGCAGYVGDNLVIIKDFESGECVGHATERDYDMFWHFSKKVFNK